MQNTAFVWPQKIVLPFPAEYCAMPCGVLSYMRTNHKRFVAPVLDALLCPHALIALMPSLLQCWCPHYCMPSLLSLPSLLCHALISLIALSLCPVACFDMLAQTTSSLCTSAEPDALLCPHALITLSRPHCPQISVLMPCGVLSYTRTQTTSA